MIRRNFLKVAGALTLGMALSGQASAETVLRVGSWLPPTHPQNAVVWPTWSKWVEEATEGRVKVKVEYGLGHPKTMFDLVEDGAIDASFSYHGYVPGRFKLTQGIEQPLLGVNAEAASVAHWRVHNKYFAKAEEHDGVELLALFTHGPGQIHMAEPIKSLADLKSKKIRLGGGVQGELGKRMGVTAVGAPAPKVYEMMQQGVIDGVFIPMSEQKSLRLKEVAKNVVHLPGGMYLGSFAMFINPDFLDGLSQKDRDAVMAVSGEKLSAMAGKAWDQGDREGVEAAKADGVNIIEVGADDSFAKEFRELVEGMDEEWIESVKSRKVDAKAALAEMREIARNYGK
ncbi:MULTISPECIES: TRAP transporter substrate-binding protein DctP [Neptunomonas]|uniref:C4-dicarboxylate ABC transporter substrate-binding protein n=1 Tax=Neptunomonas marina TaxID=1815562 RepID=A0A437QDT0_9GAMM|nr:MULTISPECIES: TRAP transporter substrate-binding protein DctP [Neptunomonas]RVU32636.1 C4-dicarboxylate ABC transporter substrate-binding protein [Neptunomonas marina]